MDFDTLVAVAALLASALAIITVWRKSGAIEGKILERLDNQQEWLRGHEQRLQGIEQANYITEEIHEKQSLRCVQSITKQIDENHSNLAKLEITTSTMEAARHSAREIDNQRWCRIEVTLGKLEEFIATLKKGNGI